MAVWQDIGKRFHWRPNKKLTIFLLCVAVASVFWLLNALTKSYVISVSVPIEYTEVPEGMLIVNAPPVQLQARLEGEGFNLLPLNSESSFQPIRIQVEQEALQPREQGRSKTVISGRTIQRQLSRQVGGLVKVLGTSLDSIPLVVERQSMRKVPVVWRGEIQTADNYRLQRVILEPDSVTLSGPGSVLRTLQSISTKQTQREGWTSSQTIPVELDLPDPLIRVNPAEVSARVEVEQVTQGSMEVPIEALQVPDSLLLRSYPSRVTVNFRVGFSRFESVGPEDFQASVGFDQLFPERPAKLRVRVTSNDPEIEIMNYAPERVEYILRNR